MYWDLSHRLLILKDKEMTDLQKISKDSLTLCDLKGWSRDWSQGGCYLHLEASEFIESLRGKGDSNPLEEGVDTLFVLVSLMANYGVDFETAVITMRERMDRLLTEGA